MATREDAQLAGIIPTTPAGAIRDERAGGAAILPDVIRQALRESWATPDAAKPAIIASLLEPFFEEREKDPVTGKPVPPSRSQLMELAKVLKLLDQTQWERDHPEEAGKAKGGASVFMQATATMRENIGAADVDRIMALTRAALGADEPTKPEGPADPS